MAASIWVQIEQNEIQPAAMDDKVFGIFLRRRFDAENAAGYGFSLGDVAITPWAPEIVHGSPSVGLRLLLVGRVGLTGATGEAVDYVFKFFAWLEVRNLLRRHLDPGSGLRVAPYARLSLASAEAAETTDLDLVSTAQGFNDAVEDGLNNDLRFLAGHLYHAGDLFNQIRFGHVHVSF